jgi:Ala-tRNA(Pro) deacylase
MIHYIHKVCKEKDETMFFVSEIYTTAPDKFSTPLQKKTYHALRNLDIPFKRVETDEAITMEDCVQIDLKLDMKMVKTLFLCNRQQTAFYLFITAGDKPFRSKDFSTALGVARVSFAPAELMGKMLGTKIGAATVFSAMLDTGNAIQSFLTKTFSPRMVWMQRWRDYGLYKGQYRADCPTISALMQSIARRE